jgi:hypothetical protein
MKLAHLILASALLGLGIGAAHAGPCTTGQAQTRDAGAGPTPGANAAIDKGGATAQTQHPPTDAMNRAAADIATSSEDTAKQQRGNPTTVQSAEGIRSPASSSDEGC